jgi:hypothetical protein
LERRVVECFDRRAVERRLGVEHVFGQHARAVDPDIDAVVELRFEPQPADRA